MTSKGDGLSCPVSSYKNIDKREAVETGQEAWAWHCPFFLGNQEMV